LRDDALEGVVLDRMVLDPHGEPLLARYQARAARHRPALHHAGELEPQVVVQARGRVLLDHEGIALATLLAAARLGRGGELPLCVVSLQAHGSAHRGGAPPPDRRKNVWPTCEVPNALVQVASED